MDLMVESCEYHGSLIAFEGPQDIISTQLRLLPNSSKLLILPSFQAFIKESDVATQFDAQSLILKIHDACHARTEMARSFLRESMPNDKRLVFMNGSTISARMSCISAISRHETNGDMDRAEAIFNELIENGAVSLKRQNQLEQNPGVASTTDATEDLDGQGPRVADDPISKAMRAADALYLETEFLQETDEFDLVTAIRHRSMSVPALPLTDDLRTTTPFNIFGSPTESTEKAQSPRLEEQNPLHDVGVSQGVTVVEDQLAGINSGTLSPNRGSELYRHNPLRPTSAVGPPRNAVESLPSSPILLGEARIVDFRPSPPSSRKRTSSVDRIYATAIRNQDISLCNLPRSSTKLEGSAQGEAQEEERVSPKKPLLRSHFYSETSYPTLIKPNRAIVRKYVPPRLNLDIEGARRSVYSNQSIGERTCAQRGTLTEPLSNVVTGEPDAGKDDSGSFLDLENDVDPVQEPFQAVLPVVEDLVIHFKGEESQPALEAMIQTFQNRTSQLSMLSLISELRGSMSQTMTPTTRSSAPDSSEKGALYSRRVTQQSTPRYSPADYDPFAVHGNYPRRPASGSLSNKDTNNHQEAIVISTPPTPAQTPPPGTEAIPDQLFHEFDIKGYKTAICIQNALRSILNVYFSPENIGYHQFNFPLLPELSSFWRPVFRETRSRDSNTTRKIDLILALGTQKSSGRGLLGSVSGSLEKLGREANGTPRTGRVDLRYLIANAMQAFTSQPLANQTQANPFSNPLLLATLIIPHLETYIAAHPTTRFLLLEYPTEYLSTVLSLQDLIGADILKVAGIIDPETNEPKSYQTHRKHSSHSITSSSVSSAGQSPSAEASEVAKGIYTSQPSFSKANFILTSGAEESEIATFIATIWRILINISDFYIPESVTVDKWKSKPNTYSLPSSSLMPSSEQYAPLLRAAVMLGFAPPLEDEQRASPNYVSSGTYADLPTPRQRPATPMKAVKPSTRAASRNSSSAARRPGTPNPRNKLKYLLGHDTAAYTTTRDAGTEDSVSYHDYEGLEEDGRFLAEERKYMPLWTQQHASGMPNRNSHKALKWLGLSN
ncbi:hypothetical protein F5B22DRAFT_288472 [Xylaria bambusicola]|uniref:uncharacterized protein n=1 Tax=Xylaria bambusicola TaxID=326684 RepID=UPI0020078395|nr:uncharacterized protein F5B22DRAFT_288472 [Xylaria bambusicola]KAI0512894.1 hypothetical protein F5B22DRAFT_288472 [Xylaria bambusicola]